MESTLALAYIEHILLKPGVALIEVWDRVLYVRMKKGCGRNKFMSKRELTYNLPVYYFQENYRNVSKQFHPDCNIKRHSADGNKSVQSSSKKGNKSQTTRNKVKTDLQKNINECKQQQWSVNTKDGRSDARSFTRNLQLFTKFTSSKMRCERSKLAESINSEIYKARFHNCSFTNGVSENEYMGSQSDYIIEEFLRELKKAFARGDEYRKKHHPKAYNMSKRAATKF